MARDQDDRDDATPEDAEARDPQDDLVDDGTWDDRAGDEEEDRPDGTEERPDDDAVRGENATTEEGEAHDRAELDDAEEADD